MPGSADEGASQVAEMTQHSSELIVYRASAGSGKTYTLAKEYLKIVLQNPYDYNKVLAVTFTRKATEEMKSRIIEYLSLLEKGDQKVEALKRSIVEELKEDKGVDISEKFQSKVSTALQLILHDYSNFNISTIDSFFQGIIRSFAKELDLPVGMEVELDTDTVIREAVQSMLREYKPEKDTFSKWIEDYLFDLIEEDKSWKIEQHIARLAKELLKEEYQLLTLHREQDFDMEEYRKVLLELKNIVYGYRQQLSELSQEVLRRIEADGIDTSLFFQGDKSVRSFINNTLKFSPEANAYLRKMLDGGELYSKSKLKDKQQQAQLEDAWNTYILHYVNSVLALKEAQHQRYRSAEIVLKNIYGLALLEFIHARIRAYKAEENLILISDTNQIISLIATHEAVPFIFEKSANFLKYILVDEFQDTSSLQWKGMLPLLLEVLQQVNGLVLIVGDPKQSIYRWRGGKMELIMDGIAPDMSYHWERKKEIPLNDNYRSAREVVEFNNSFFRTIKETISLRNPLFKRILDDAEQQFVRKEIRGFVQCSWLDKETKEEDPQLEEVRKTVQSLYPARRYRDIAVLTRNNADGIAIANHLQQQGIPVVSAESLLLANHAQVSLLIAALQYILHPREDFYAVKLNYQYAVCQAKPEPESYLQKHPNDPYSFEQELPMLSRERVEPLGSMAVQELLFLLLQTFGMDQRSNAYLMRFEDVVLQFSQKGPGLVQDFLRFWEEQQDKLSIIPPDGMDAVRIYTIHKSKGLQFPVVILPYADWNMKPKPDTTLWLSSDEPPFRQLRAFPAGFHKHMEESLFADTYVSELKASYIDNVNLLYVAFTRAEERLYIFSSWTKSLEDPKKAELLPSSVSRLLWQTLKQMDKDAQLEKAHVFRYGDPEPAIEAQEPCIQAEFILPASLSDFRQQIRLITREEYSEAQVKGKLLHSVLSKVYAPEEMQKALRSGPGHTRLTSDYAEAAAAILGLFRERGWFDPKWRPMNERAIWLGGKELRPDKVLLSEEECVIIDYKTGAKQKQYEEQVRTYMQAYAGLHPQKVSGFLIYLETKEVVEVIG